MATLSLQNINKVYDNGVQAVFDFNLDIKDKEFVVFVGPSGCGKSTTLRMIAGFENISRGKLFIDNAFVNSVAPKDRNIAMVFQNYALYQHMTVYENLSFALELRKIPCPVLNPGPDTQRYIDEEIKIRNDIKVIKKKFIKDQNSGSLLKEYSRLCSLLIEAYEKKIASMKQVSGIDEDTIKELTIENKLLDKRIAKIDKELVKHSSDKDYVSALKEIFEQKRIQYDENRNRIDFLTNHEVPLFKKRHLTKEEIDIKIHKTAFAIDLIRYLYRLPGELSGGQRQRVALGRAIVREPKVFLMDEPLSNLDAKLRVQTRGEILRIHKRVGATTVYVTHDQTEAMTMADRIVVMKDGYVQQIGTPEEIYNQPANVFVASFIGNPAMNFIYCEVKDNGVFIQDTEIKIDVSKEQLAMLLDKGCSQIVLGIRPEKLMVDEEKESDACFTVNYDYDELLGNEKVVYGLLNDKQLVSKFDVEHIFEAKDKICFRYRYKDLYFFRKETGKAVI